MLYVTTRNDRETFTVSRVINDNRGPDGGLFVPFHNPVFSKEEIPALLGMSFEDCTAQVLNRLLGLRLMGWDISFYAGRYPVRVRSLGYHTMIAESWHNPQWCFQRFILNLAQLLDQKGVPSQWLNIAVRSAVFAGILAQCHKNGLTEPLDIAVVSGDFSAPLSAWYVRSWGFPVGNIICCCNENGDLWDLFANGQMRTDGITIPTNTPDADTAVPESLEQLICACGGAKEVMRYVEVCRQGATYYPPDAVWSKLQEGMYVSVVGDMRITETISSVYGSREYLLSPYDALCYCGVSDYRARFGETGQVLIFSEKSPVWDSATVATALGIPEEELKNHL